MAYPRSTHFSTNGALAASSCGANALPQPIFDFGFAASALRLVNTCGPRMFFNLSGDPATTADGYLTCGDTLEVIGGGFASTGLGLASTSTSTGSGGQPIYGVTAWASA